MPKSKKIWSGRLKESAKLLSDFNDSLSFDKRLYKEDIEGSIAHVKMLAKCKIITGSDSKKIISGLVKIQKQIEEKKDKWFIENKNEDIHSAIEAKLTSLIGDVGKKIHTARSRNDQVSTDLRLWLKKELKEINLLLGNLRSVLLKKAKQNYLDIMPGYTHMQLAQPITIGHYLMAHVERLERDIVRFKSCFNSTDVMPLGSGALSGTTFSIDRKYTAKLLGFSEISSNSLDAVSDRDFICETLFSISMLSVHLSGIAEEMILFSTSEFSFVEISDLYSTGSSMMPQKKNPDIPELIRGKTGRHIGNLIGILSVLKGLPLAYNKDLQEDKELLFDSVDNIKITLKITKEFLENITFNKKRMKEAVQHGFTQATDIADYLTKKGLPFRKAYSIVGEIVSYCHSENISFNNLTLSEWKKFSSVFDSSIEKIISVENCIRARNTFGGTSPAQVLKAVQRKNIYTKNL